MMYLFGILGKTLKNSEGINFFQEITHIIEKKNQMTSEFNKKVSIILFTYIVL